MKYDTPEMTVLMPAINAIQYDGVCPSTRTGRETPSSVKRP
jgi:hypothetical protein